MVNIQSMPAREALRRRCQAATSETSVAFMALGARTKRAWRRRARRIGGAAPAKTARAGALRRSRTLRRPHPTLPGGANLPGGGAKTLFSLFGSTHEGLM